ncbi:MAG: HAMP domain-containing protein, partial [Lachnospiraceae bacterium]|nr:HAMP domain-containing protein [Lachnospiraceae bacterium]
MSMWDKVQVKTQKKLKDKKIKGKLSSSFNKIVTSFVVTSVVAFLGLLIILAQYYTFYKNYVPEKTEAVARMFSVSSILALVLIVVIVLAVIACVCISAFYQKALTKVLRDPIEELEDATKDLKDGKLDFEITYQSKDELGDLSENFRDAGKHLKSIVSDMGAILSQMSEGDFSADTADEEVYVGDFAEL